MSCAGPTQDGFAAIPPTVLGEDWIAAPRDPDPGPGPNGGPHAEPKPETPEQRSRRRRVSTWVFLTVFIDFLGLGVLLPVIPFLVERFDQGAFAVGILGAAFALSQFAATPVLGALSDRLGRRPVLIASLVGSAAGYLVLGLAGALWVMLVARVIDGVTGANVSTAQAALADITPAARRSRAFALIGVAMGLGFVLGPMLGGVLAHDVGLTAPVFAAGGLSLAAGLFALLMLPETLSPARRRTGPLSLQEINPLAHLGSAWGNRPVRFALLALLCAGVPFAGLSNNLGVYLDRVFAMGPREAAFLFTWLGVVMMVMQGVVVRRISGHTDDRAVAAFGLLLFAAGLLTIAFTPSAHIWGLYVGIGLFAAGHALLSPTLTGIISRAVGPGAQGAALGTATGMLSLTRVAGPLLAGLLFDRLAPNAPYWTGAIWTLLALLALLPLRRQPAAAPATPCPTEP